MGLFLPSEVARLVLGYLEEENCEKAYEEFLSSSPHLQECRESNRNLGFFSMGCSLVDILEDYSAVNNFVLNFHSTKTLKRQIIKCHSLLEKIKFICKKDDTSFEEKSFRENEENLLNNCNNSEKNSIASKADFSFNVNTTPASDLPGHIPTSSKRDELNKNNLSFKDQLNESIQSKESKKYLDKSVSEDGRNSTEETAFKKALGLVKLSDITDQSIQSKTPNKRKPLKYKGSQSARKLTDGIDTFPNESINVTAITSALLDYTELHEKIAENINNLIASTSMKSFEKNSFTDSGTATDQNSVPFIIEDETTQMNNVIKNIVDKTEKDPLFDQFLNDVLDNMAPAESTSGTESDTISRPETSTPEKSAPSFAEDSSPTPINHFLLDDEAYKSFNRKCSYSRDRNKYSKGKSLKNFTDELSSKSSNQPKFTPRLSRGGKRMDLLKENYKKTELSDISNDNSVDSLCNDTIVVPYEPEPTPAQAEPVVQEKPGKVKIISDIKVQANVTDKGNVIIQKGSVTEVTNLKPFESFSVINPISQPFLIVDPSGSSLGTIKTSSNALSLNQIDPSTLSFQKLHIKPSDLIISSNGGPIINTKLKAFDDKNKPQTCNVIAPLSSVVPSNYGSFVETIKPVNDVKSLPEIQPAPLDSIVIIDNPGTNINNPQEIISKAPVICLPDNAQISIKTPNVPTSNTNSNSGTRKGASHVRVLDFNEAKKEAKKELVKKAFMSPIRVKKSPVITKTKNPNVECSPISILNKDVIKTETTGLSDVWSDTLGVNQIIKPQPPITVQPFTSWDARLRAVVEPDIQKLNIPQKSKKKKTPKKIKTKEKCDQDKNRTKKTNKKISKQKVVKDKNVKSNDKPIATATVCPGNNEETVIHKKDVEPKIIQKKQESVPVPSNGVQSLEKPKNHSILSMNTLLETPIKPHIFDLSINTPKFLNDKPVTISAIKIDEITTPFFKKTPQGLIASLFGTPGSGSTTCYTDYSSSSSYYKPDEIEDIYFTKDNDNELDKTSIANNSSPIKDPSPKKDTELEKENLSDRVLRPRRKSTKFSNYITSTSTKKNSLSKSSDSEKSFNSTGNDSSFSKSSKPNDKNKNSNKPLKPKDEPENRLVSNNDTSTKLSPQSHKQLLNEKASRIKSKLNAVKPTILKPPKGILKKILTSNRTTKQNLTIKNSKKTKDVNDKKTLDLKTKENTTISSEKDQYVSNKNLSQLPSKSRRKSSTPRKLEKVDTPISPQAELGSLKKSKKEDEPRQKHINLHCDEHFPTLNINMYSSENGDSEDDLIGVKNFINDGHDIELPKPVQVYKSTEEQITRELTDISVEKTGNGESLSKETSLDESNDHVIIWSEYDINSSHPKYINASHDIKHHKKKLTDAQRKEIHGYVLNAGIFNTLHDCDEERAIGVSDIFNIFELRPDYKSIHAEKRKRETKTDEQASKISKPEASGLQLLMNEFKKSGDSLLLDDSPNTKAKKELDSAVESIMVIDEEQKPEELEFESPKKINEEKKNESSPDISSSKKLLTQVGIDSLLSLLHGPDKL